jgi:serine/threonine protein kinase
MKSSLDAGSFSKVYLAIRKKDKLKESNKRDGMRFAIKMIKKELLLKQPISLKCLVKEIKVLRFLDHPNIVKLYEVYETSAHIYLVMEYVEGGDLLSYLDKKKQYNEKDAIVIMKQVLDALKHCHPLNITHRDIKPENIMIEYLLTLRNSASRNNKIKVIDFGLAELLDSPILKEPLVDGI